MLRDFQIRIFFVELGKGLSKQTWPSLPRRYRGTVEDRERRQLATDHPLGGHWPDLEDHIRSQKVRRSGRTRIKRRCEQMRRQFADFRGGKKSWARKWFRSHSSSE
jgi:hypothetical protein